jgi:hypothetical protein
MSLARTLQFTYGGLTVGGTSGRHIDAYTLRDSAPDRGVFECTFVTLACTTTAAFVAETAAIETALSTPRGALAFTDGGNTIVSWSHSSNTGFDGVAMASKVGAVGDTGLSCRYKFRLEVGLPADSRYNTSGRRTGTVDVKYDPSSRRHVTFRATYTALSGNAARAQMDAAFATWCTGWMSTLSITSYQKAEVPSTPGNDTDKVIEAVAIYDELVYKSGIFADTSIIRAEMRISREKQGPGDSPTADRLAVVNAQFDCWVDKTATTALQSKYASIRSTIATQIRAALELGQICLVSDRVEFDWVNNKISATLVLWGTTGGSVLEYRYTTDMNKETGLVLIPAWTGDPLSYFVTPGPARYLNTITITRRVLGNSTDVGANASPVPGADAFTSLAAADAGATGGDGSAGAASGGGAGAPGTTGPSGQAGQDVGTESIVPIGSRKSKTPLRIGTHDEAQIDVTDETEVTVTQVIKRLRGSTGGGSATVVTPDVHPELNRNA